MSAASQVDGPIGTSPSQTSAPRKRRRRAPATGAAEDCFACSTRHTKCDRRRPYCTQCLDRGKQCSGYKTTLTWGVGVASRGKLRGLSLPIAGKQNVPSTASAQAQRKRNSVHDGNAGHIPAQAFTNPFGPGISISTSINTPSYATTFDFVNSNPSTVPPPDSAWQHHAQRMPSTSQPPAKSMSPPRTLNSIHVPYPGSYEELGAPTSASSISGFSDNGYGSPIIYSASSEEPTYVSFPVPGQDGMLHSKGWRSMSNANSNIDERGSTSWARGSLSSSIVSSQSGHDFAEPLPKPENNIPYNSNYVDDSDKNNKASQNAEEEDIDEVFCGNGGTCPLDSMSSDFNLKPAFFNGHFSETALSMSPVFPQSIGSTPRLKYLINYYTEVISPVIVAFDGPTNPYRTSILRLAMESQTLQHAIAALSASNLRMRRDNKALSTGRTSPARRSSIAHCAMTDEAWGSQIGFLSAEDQAREELYHKGVSIQSLNAQLADPSRRRDDSVLATLLILCLFHICDTGVAKFKTQFAGVKKLLSLRDNDLGSGSKETKWYTRMFTWFDAMTATVNDREGQLQGGHLDMASLSDEEWALENLAGCDGRLFKIIAKLGRLNVLSQNKSVEDCPVTASRPPVVDSFNGISFDGTFSRFDGNGWASLLADEDLFNTSDSTRTQFWREWRDIRQSLQDWKLDTSIYDSKCTAAFEPNRADLSNISESFRFSAILYTERLAFPHLSSSHPKIQGLVTQALHFITEVKSDVYLLWPLFITGSECVEGSHRSIIRQRCLDIQKDSGFFNNISCLDLLEKIWRENKPHQSDTLATNDMITSGQCFKWRNVMNKEKSEGEYIVV